MEPFDRRGLQPVAVAQALGNEVDDVAAEHLERAAKNDGGRDAVDVVVAVDGDPFLARDGRLEALDRLGHVAEPIGIVQMVERRTQKASGRLGIAQSAQAQQPRDRGMEVQRVREAPGALVVTRQMIPEDGLHSLVSEYPTSPILRNFS
jgi:hypothetical protein